MNTKDQIEYRGYNILLEPDTTTHNPYKEWDQVSDVVFWCTGLNLDSVGAGRFNFRYPEEVQEAYLSGELAYYSPCRLNTGVAGMVFVTAEQAKKHWPKVRRPDLWEVCKEAAKVELKALNQWLDGDVWGYSVWKVGGKNKWEESCWGFFGREYCLQEAKKAVDCLVAEEDLRIAQATDEWWDWSGAIMYGGGS